jgi:hypothetical protein
MKISAVGMLIIQAGQFAMLSLSPALFGFILFCSVQFVLTYYCHEPRLHPDLEYIEVPEGGTCHAHPGFPGFGSTEWQEWLGQWPQWSAGIACMVYLINYSVFLWVHRVRDKTLVFKTVPSKKCLRDPETFAATNGICICKEMKSFETGQTESITVDATSSGEIVKLTRDKNGLTVSYDTLGNEPMPGKYKAKCELVVWEGYELTSKKVGRIIRKDEDVKLVESRSVRRCICASGTVRARLEEGGWITSKCRTTNDTLGRVDHYKSPDFYHGTEKGFKVNTGADKSTEYVSWSWCAVVVLNALLMAVFVWSVFLLVPTSYRVTYDQAFGGDRVVGSERCVDTDALVRIHGLIDKIQLDYCTGNAGSYFMTSTASNGGYPVCSARNWTNCVMPCNADSTCERCTELANSGSCKWKCQSKVCPNVYSRCGLNTTDGLHDATEHCTAACHTDIDCAMNEVCYHNLPETRGDCRFDLLRNAILVGFVFVPLIFSIIDLPISGSLQEGLWSYQAPFLLLRCACLQD